MMAGERIFGAVTLENHERDNAFGPAEVRLLETVTASMAVALLNAKSYEAERQRAAELAIDQQRAGGLAGELEPAGVSTTLVGEKIREIFDAQSVGIRRLRRVHRTGQLSRTRSSDGRAIRQRAHAAHDNARFVADLCERPASRWSMARGGTDDGDGIHLPTDRRTAQVDGLRAAADQRKVVRPDHLIQNLDRD